MFKMDYVSAYLFQFELYTEIGVETGLRLVYGISEKDAEEKLLSSFEGCHVKVYNLTIK